MRLTKISLTFACLLAMQYASSQIIIEGKVLNQKSKEPIPFTNIGIFKSNIGTLSNEDGSFSLTVPEKLINDSVTFSSLGFEMKSIAVRSFLTSRNATIFLMEKPSLLKEVSVKAKRMKAKTFQLGNAIIKGGNLQEDTTFAGRSIALLIENKNPKRGGEFPLYLEKASLHILRNNLKSCRFRVRINEVDEKTGLPGSDLLQKSLIVESTKKSGWLEFDLSSLNMIVSKSFFVTFEQLTTKDDRVAIASGYRKFISDYPDRVKYDTVLFEGKKEVRHIISKGGIDLPGTIIGVSPLWEKFTCYVSPVSLGEWVKVRSVVAATVTVSTQSASGKTKK